jgi:hypothetical protein
MADNSQVNTSQGHSSIQHMVSLAKRMLVRDALTALSCSADGHRCVEMSIDLRGSVHLDWFCSARATGKLSASALGLVDPRLCRVLRGSPAMPVLLNSCAVWTTLFPCLTSTASISAFQAPSPALIAGHLTIDRKNHRSQPGRRRVEHLAFPSVVPR